MKIFTLLSFFVLLAFTGSAQLVDGNLETGPGGYWNEASTNFGTPLCDVGSCGTCGGPCVAQSGSWYAWFGGAGGATEEGSFNQDLTVPNGSTAEITFYAKIAPGGSGSTQDVLRMQMDGVTYWEITGADSAAFSSYQMVSVNVGAFTDGGTHWLNFEGNNNSGTNINMLIDNISLTVDGSPAVGINELLNHETEVVVYPNPAVNELNVVFNHEITGNGMVRIYDINGKLVNQELFTDIFNKKYTLDTSNLENGLYHIEVEAGDNLVTQRFMVQR